MGSEANCRPAPTPLPAGSAGAAAVEALEGVVADSTLGELRAGPISSRTDNFTQLKGHGSGWGGTRTPSDDFVEQRRKCKWLRARPAPSLPPRVYVDSRTLIREVTDLCSLQRGDHCLIAINLFRGASPALDYLVSCLGSIEICYLYHHFILVDDVHYVDEHGVPRTKEHTPAMIFECGNTVPEALAEIGESVSGRLLHRALQFPMVLVNFILFFKAKFTLHPLADYGDTPHLYTVVGSKQTPEERERAVTEALRLARQHDRYHVVYNNCEHTCNKISKGVHNSAMVSFGLWVLFRVLLGLVGLMALRLGQDLMSLAGACYTTICSRSWALAAYHLFTSVPVALQVMVSYGLLTRSVWKQHSQAFINHHDCCHLLAKELGRAVVVGGSTLAAIMLTPQAVSSSCLRFVVCAFAYLASDVVFNCCAHAVMRLVLLPAYGRVWLFGPKPKAD